MNKAFEKWWRHPTGSYGDRPFPSSGGELAEWCNESFEAGQSSSAARIAELEDSLLYANLRPCPQCDMAEARVKELEQLNATTEQRLTKWRNKYNHAIETGVVTIADEQERIAELEAANANLEWICDKRQKAIDRQTMRSSDWQRVVDGLEADCKAMARGLDLDFTHGLQCDCPACIIAGKYREGK